MSDLFHQTPLDQLAELSRILSINDIRNQLTDASEALPLPSLFAYLEPDDSGQERIIHMSYLPVEEDFEEIHLLQIFFPFPTKVSDNSWDALRVILLEMNTKLPLGHVSVRRDGEIFYRYILPISRAFLDEDVMGEIMDLFMAVCLSIYDIVVGVATGNVDLEVALDFLDQI